MLQIIMKKLGECLINEMDKLDLDWRSIILKQKDLLIRSIFAKKYLKHILIIL